LAQKRKTKKTAIRERKKTQMIRRTVIPMGNKKRNWPARTSSGGGGNPFTSQEKTGKAVKFDEPSPVTREKKLCKILPAKRAIRPGGTELLNEKEKGRGEKFMGNIVEGV